MLLPNALAALHNCSLDRVAIGLIGHARRRPRRAAPHRRAPGRGSARASRESGAPAAVLAKCAIALSPPRSTMLGGHLERAPRAAPRAVVLVEGSAHDASGDAPRVVDLLTDEVEGAGAGRGGQPQLPRPRIPPRPRRRWSNRLFALTACAGAKAEVSQLSNLRGQRDAVRKVKLLNR